MSVRELVAPPEPGSLPAVEAAAVHARAAVARLASAVASAGEGAALLAGLAELLQLADRVEAGAVEAVGVAREWNAAERVAGLPLEQLVMLEGRRTGADARTLVRASEVLATLPLTASAFADGRLSWGQVRPIVLAAAVLPVAARGQVDAQVAADAARGGDADPDWLVGRAADVAERSRADLAERREQRAVEQSFVAVQQRLEGGGTLYAELDALGMATVLEGLDAAADRPVAATAGEGEDGGYGQRRRGTQLADGMVRLADT